MNTDIGLNEQGNYHMLSAEALLAGTLALMTAHAQCSCPKAMSSKDLMMKKIIANLSQLISHAHLTEQFRMTLGNLHKMWTTFEAAQQSDVNESKTQQSSSQTVLQHTAPTVLH